MVLRRLRRLAVLELFNVFLIPVAFFWWMDLPLTRGNLAGAAGALVILLEGAAYWRYKARQLTGAAPDPRWLRCFALLRALNPVMLAVALPVIVVGLATAPLGHALPGLVLWMLGVAEHVNYFHWQLMYDNRSDLRWLRDHGLKRAHLARDLKQARVAPRTQLDPEAGDRSTAALR